jgi:exonuclease III
MTTNTHTLQACNDHHQLDTKEQVPCTLTPPHQNPRLLTALTLNVRGISGKELDVTALVQQHDPDICILTETRHTTGNKRIRTLKHKTGLQHYQLHHSVHTANHATGVIIAVKNTLAIPCQAEALLETAHHIPGRLLTVQLHPPNSKPLLVTGVYAPSQRADPDRRHVYTVMNNTLTQFDNAEHIVSGDWNTPLLPTQGPHHEYMQHATNMKTAGLMARIKPTEPTWRHGRTELTTTIDATSPLRN